MDYIEKSIITNTKIISVHSFVFDLTFCGSHQIADSNLSILSPISLDVAHFKI
jgi:hypothetical protein